MGGNAGNDAGAASAPAGDSGVWERTTPSPAGVPQLRNVRALLGPNLWRPAPAVVAEVAGGSADALAHAVAVLSPTLDSKAALADDGPIAERWARTLAVFSILLQQRAGARLNWWSVAEHDGPESRLIAVDYEDERVGTRSVRLAHSLLREAASRSSVDIDTVIVEL